MEMGKIDRPTELEQEQGFTHEVVREALGTSAKSEFLNGIKGKMLPDSVHAIAREAVNDNHQRNPITGEIFTTGDLDAIKAAA